MATIANKLTILSEKILTKIKYDIYPQCFQNIRTIRLLFKKWGRNEYLFDFLMFHLFFSKSVKIVFLNLKGHLREMTRFHTSYLCEL